MKRLMINISLFIIFFIPSISLSQDCIILVTKKGHKLSHMTENYFATQHVQQGLKQNNYILYKYDESNIREYVRAWNLKWYPSILHIRKINNKWYKVGILDGQLTQRLVDKFLNIRHVNQPDCPPGRS